MHDESINAERKAKLPYFCAMIALFSKSLPHFGAIG